jgi:uncharacterized protein YkwD
MTKIGFLFRDFFLNFCVASFLLLRIGTWTGSGLSDEVLKYTNELRKSKGLTALVMREDLNAIAHRHSEDMAKGRCSFGHSGYDQRESEAQRIIKPFYGMAENVAFGASTGKEVVSLWKSSPNHRRNMLGNYEYIGIGTARDSHGAIYYTEIFVR